jgi:hypothetical protein
MNSPNSCTVLHQFQWWVADGAIKFWVSISWADKILWLSHHGHMWFRKQWNSLSMMSSYTGLFVVRKSSCEISAKKTITVLDGVELSVKSPCLHPLFGLLLLSPPVPYFSGICKVRNLRLNLSMKCWNSAVNAAQSSRVIIVVCWSGSRSSENICSSVAAVEAAFRKKEGGDLGSNLVLWFLTTADERVLKTHFLKINSRT